MLPIKYTYLLGASLFLIPWLIIFWQRKDLRNLLLLVGSLFTILGIIAAYLWWTKDWWRPYTITNTIVGIEDVILGFASSGVCACLYLVLFRKKLVENKNTNLSKNIFNLLII